MTSEGRTEVAVVTGGARGVGRAACLLLAAEGASVAVTDTRDEEGEKLAEAIRENGGKAEYWHLDVSDESQARRVFAEIHERFGKIDSLINNAGAAGLEEAVPEDPESGWGPVTASRIRRILSCTRHALPYLERPGPDSIVNLGSERIIAGALGEG
jgi:NAD(P)-dependent dehydrogenase (short-subunit alcohol dehydrogenase family)